MTDSSAPVGTTGGGQFVNMEQGVRRLENYLAELRSNQGRAMTVYGGDVDVVSWALELLRTPSAPVADAGRQDADAEWFQGLRAEVHLEGFATIGPEHLKRMGRIAARLRTEPPREREFHSINEVKRHYFPNGVPPVAEPSEPDLLTIRTVLDRAVKAFGAIVDNADGYDKSTYMGCIIEATRGGESMGAWTKEQLAHNDREGREAWKELRDLLSRLRAPVAVAPETAERRLLRWAIQQIDDAAEIVMDTNGTPMHWCEFDRDPEKGACDWHDNYWTAKFLLDAALAAPAPAQPAEP